MGDLHVRSEVAFGRGLWLRMKAMSKELGNGGCMLTSGAFQEMWMEMKRLYVVKEGGGRSGEIGMTGWMVNMGR
jgi:hypothetical protein